MAEAVEKVFRALREATLIRAAALHGKIDSLGSRFGFNSCAEAMAVGLLRQPRLIADYLIAANGRLLCDPIADVRISGPE